jgi:hypothetical protein
MTNFEIVSWSNSDWDCAGGFVCFGAIHAVESWNSFTLADEVEPGLDTGVVV